MSELFAFWSVPDDQEVLRDQVAFLMAYYPRSVCFMMTLSEVLALPLGAFEWYSEHKRRLIRG